MDEVESSAMWIAIYMYKLYSICYCIHATNDEVRRIRKSFIVELIATLTLCRGGGSAIICITLDCIRTI